MFAAVEACKNGMPYSTASKHFGVPRMTLKYKVLGETPMERKMGPKTVLTVKEENKLVEWIREIIKRGFPPKKDDLILTVQRIITNSGRTTPFVDNKPGKKWLQLFLKRHPDLSQRILETLTTVRASGKAVETERCEKKVVVGNVFMEVEFPPAILPLNFQKCRQKWEHIADADVSFI
ncbi:hypothetical protein NQ314_017502 [Rhamnusium bicolor]|uniref:HTH CENPB-type domain-containing protein n=1 Tax=Rhamnusium bicolor TaxID=1586634 RepID=A0AAV8WTQ9_9CUCU|nr:hypothetical protein NQ314_017502 [Rhamnusium bicolor]